MDADMAKPSTIFSPCTFFHRLLPIYENWPCLDRTLLSFYSSMIGLETAILPVVKILHPLGSFRYPALNKQVKLIG